MRIFRDHLEQAWKIDLNIGNVLHVRSASSGRFDLLNPTHDVDGQPLQVVLYSDLGEFWTVLWLLVESQAKKESVTAEQFGQAMAADCLVEAQLLFFEEWTDFFHSLRRPDAALAVESQAKVQEAAVRLVTAKIQAMDHVKLGQKIESTVERAVNAAYGTVQASLDAILGPTPGDSLT